MAFISFGYNIFVPTALELYRYKQVVVRLLALERSSKVVAQKLNQL